MFYVSAISPFLSPTLFSLLLMPVTSIHDPGWILDFVLHVSISALLLSFFEMRLLYLILESLLLAIYVGRRALYGLRGKGLPYKK
jgi:hypothetical protein